jgi:hypothetical protein
MVVQDGLGFGGPVADVMGALRGLGHGFPIGSCGGIIHPTPPDTGREVISPHAGRTSAWPKVPHFSQRNRRSIDTKVISSGKPAIDMLLL